MGPISLLSKVAFIMVLRCGWENKNYHGVLSQILGNKEFFLNILMIFDNVEVKGGSKWEFLGWKKKSKSPLKASSRAEHSTGPLWDLKFWSFSLLKIKTCWVL